MKFFHEETSLVLAGAWNPAILTPAWVLQHGLDKALDGTNRYQAFMPAGFGLIFEAPRYVLDDLTFSVRPDALIIVPKSESAEALTLTEDVAARMLGQLMHTPVAGVGHNFEFREQNPQAEQLEIFTQARQDLADVMPDGWEPTTASVVAAFVNAAGNVVVNVQRAFDGREIVIKVNFHHAVSSAEQAISVLTGADAYQRMASNMDVAKVLLAKIYGDLE
jgi:hypothetical protein